MEKCIKIFNLMIEKSINFEKLLKYIEKQMILPIS